MPEVWREVQSVFAELTFGSAAWGNMENWGCGHPWMQQGPSLGVLLFHTDLPFVWAQSYTQTDFPCQAGIFLKVLHVPLSKQSLR